GVKVERSDTPLVVPWREEATAAEVRAAFADAHARHFGFAAEGPLVVEWIEAECAAANDALRVIAGGDSPLPDRRKAIHGGCGRGVPAAHAPARGDMTQTRPKPATARPIWIDGAWRDTPIHRRETLPAGVTIDGPALLVE